jgi:peptidyl-prolyl cis-trans isomerase B (cyclophilin B)
VAAPDIRPGSDRTRRGGGDVSPNARDRARAKRRYVKRQAKLAQKHHARRVRQQVIGAAVAVVLVVFGVFALTRLNSSPSKKTATPPAATPTSTASPTASACPKATTKPVAKPQQFKSAPPKSLAANRTWTATVATTCGTMTFTLDGKKAPQTVASFIFLARKGFFANTPCHRLTTSGLYVLQCGDPTGTGSGGPGYTFGIENAPSTGDYPAGTVAMARETAPNTNGSQFFIVYQDSKLPTDGGGYTIFGRVSSGLDVVKNVAVGGAPSNDGAPNTPINITSVSVK